MQIRSTRFGDLEISEENILSFPNGLPGFPDERQFAFFSYHEDSAFSFLQSMAEPDLTFVIVEPFSFVKDYSFELDDNVVRELEITEDAPPQVYNIVRIPEKVEEITANLAAPIVINRVKRLAAQIIMDKSNYSVRHRLFSEGFPRKKTKGGE